MAISPERLTQDEYENQYYDMSTTDLNQKFKEIVKKIIQNALDDIEREVLKSAEHNEKFAKDVHDRINKLYAVYMESAKHGLDKFDEEARQIFAIPPNVIFKEDKLKTEQVTDNDIDNLKKEVFDLEQILISEKVFLAKCQQMKEIFETTIDPIITKIDNVMTAANRHFQKTTASEENRILELYISKVQQFFKNTENPFSFISNHKKLC